MAVYVYRNNRQQGPYEEPAVAEGLRNGSLSPDDLACFVGSDRWAPLGSLFPHLLRAPQPRRPRALRRRVALADDRDRRRHPAISGRPSRTKDVVTSRR